MLNTEWEELVKDHKGPLTKTAYKKGLTDFLEESVKQLKRLRRKTKHWRGVNKCIDLIENLKPEKTN